MVNSASPRPVTPSPLFVARRPSLTSEFLTRGIWCEQINRIRAMPTRPLLQAGYFAGARCAIEQSSCRRASQFARYCQALLKIEARTGDPLHELAFMNLREFFEVGSQRIVHYSILYRDVSFQCSAEPLECFQ